MSCWSRASRPTTLTRKRLQDHVKATIAPYKYPRSVKFIDALPKTQTGKIQRFRLREPDDDRFRADPRAVPHPGGRRSISTAIRSGRCRIAAKARVADMLAEEWGKQLIRGWNSAGWMHAAAPDRRPHRQADRRAGRHASSWATRCRSRSTRRWPRRSTSIRSGASCCPTAAISRPTSTWRRA